MRNFLEPVDVEGLGLTDYNDVIERPMDLQTLRENVKSGNIYKNPRDFGRDLRLIFKIAVNTIRRAPAFGQPVDLCSVLRGQCLLFLVAQCTE